MPAPRLHENIIAQKIVDLIDQNLSGPLGLKVVTVNDLGYFPAREVLQEVVPSVFVKPSPSTLLERITTGQTYRIVYSFRIVFVSGFGPKEEITKAKIAGAQQIGELLIDNVDLETLSLPNGQVLFTLLRQIEWDPPENDLVNDINADMTAVAMIFTVDTSSRK